MKYRFVGDHVDQLEDGTDLIPGEFIDLKKDQLRQDRTEELIAGSKLVATDKRAEEELDLAKRRFSTREGREQEETESLQEEGEVSKNA